MTRDPVCGMQVDESKGSLTAVHKGKAFYFCGPSCKEKFIKEPQKYETGVSSPGCC